MNYADRIREWVKQTIPELAFSATDAELEKLAGLIAEDIREQCAWECEMAGINGYGTLAAAECLRRRQEWEKTDSLTLLSTI